MKRRVYDALNVLIAAGILTKEDKHVSCAENTDNIGIIKKNKLKEETKKKKMRNVTF